MISKSLFPLTVTHKKITNVLINAISLPFSSGISASYDPPAFVICTLNGATTDIPIVIAGTLSGVGQTESVTVMNPVGQVRSTKKWSTVTSIASSGSYVAVGTFKGIYGSGQPAVAETTITTTMKGRLRAARLPNIIESDSGPQLLERWYFYTNEYSNISTGDLLAINGINYEVESAERVYDGTQSVHHGRIFLKRFN